MFGRVYVTQRVWSVSVQESICDFECVVSVLRRVYVTLRAWSVIVMEIIYFSEGLERYCRGAYESSDIVCV